MRSAKKIMILSLFLFLLLLFTGCNGNVHHSKNWKVVVHSAKFEQNFGTAPNQLDGLVIHIDIQYIGEDGKAAMPNIFLKKGDADIRAKGLHFDKEGSAAQMRLLYAILGDTKKYVLKHGENITTGKCYVIFEIPETDDKLELVVGDVKPIRL